VGGGVLDCGLRRCNPEDVESVFLLWHQFEFPDLTLDDLEERAKLIGAYRSRAAAEQAVERGKISLASEAILTAS